MGESSCVTPALRSPNTRSACPKLEAATSTSGYIWGYIGAWENPWYLAGQYDAYYDYYYNYRGGFLNRIERSTGSTTYPSACGWITANTTCPLYAIVGGGSSPSNPFIAQALLDVNDTWLLTP